MVYDSQDSIWQSGYDTAIEEVLELINEIECNETFCFKCGCGFDEDSDEYFRCNGKDIEHRELDISREKLKRRVEALPKKESKR